mgnify:CR=1 FL=1
MYELPDWEPRQAIRRLWIAKDFWVEFDAIDELHEVRASLGRRSIGEHIEAMFNDLRCAERPSAGDLRRMMPNKDGIWKLHPPGARVYGWCPFPESFVAVTLALEPDTKDKSKGNVNNEKRNLVKQFIHTNKLEKYVVLGDILAIFPPKT